MAGWVVRVLSGSWEPDELVSCASRLEVLAVRRDARRRGRRVQVRRVGRVPRWAGWWGRVWAAWASETPRQWRPPGGVP